MALKGTAAFPLTVVSGGINRLRTKGGADKNSLYDLLNGYVTASNTVKVRPGTTRNANLGPVSGAGVTKGLVGYQGELHVFAPSVVPVPAGYQLHVLGHPASALPPSTPAANVQSLMHFEDGNGSTTFTDNGTAGATWAAVAGAAESTAQSKFGTGSLSVPATANACIETSVIAGGQLDLTQQDYTVEGWFYTAAWANNQYLMDFTGPSNNILFEVYLDVSGAIHIKEMASTIVKSSANGAFTKSTWHHVAVTRYGSLVSLYLDGTLVSASITLTTQLFSQVIPANYFIGVGGSFIGGGLGLGFNGYVDDFRIMNGQAVYQATGFTPPATTLGTYVAPYASAIGTVLHFDDGNGSTAFLDNGVHAQTWTGSAGAVETTAQQQFGIGSLYVPGTDDYISTPQLSGGALDFTNEDFTVECWVRPTATTLARATATKANICDFSGGAATMFDGYISKSGANYVVTMQAFGNWGGSDATTTAGINTAGWNHVVFMRRNNVFAVGLNGTLYYGNSHPGAGTALGAGKYAFIGATSLDGAQNDAWGGYIDDVIITTGIAKYGSSVYTVPAGPINATNYTVIPLKEIHFAAPYLGGLYVVAEFEPVAGVNGGTVFHYWIQSSISGSNVNEWTANTDYQIGDMVIPDTPNGLTYVASRKSAPNPTWTPSTAAHAASTGVAATVVEPTVPNGFMYTAVSTLGTNPTTGETEPTWPTSDGATVQDLSELSNDASISNLPTISPPTPAPTTPTRYIPLLGG